MITHKLSILRNVLTLDFLIFSGGIKRDQWLIKSMKWVMVESNLLERKSNVKRIDEDGS